LIIIVYTLSVPVVASSWIGFFASFSKRADTHQYMSLAYLLLLSYRRDCALPCLCVMALCASYPECTPCPLKSHCLSSAFFKCSLLWLWTWSISVDFLFDTTVFYLMWQVLCYNLFNHNALHLRDWQFISVVHSMATFMLEVFNFTLLVDFLIFAL
jgi:hypothetical protein